MPTHSCRFSTQPMPLMSKGLERQSRVVLHRASSLVRLAFSVQDARAHVMCGHRLTKICWQRLTGHCAALLMLSQCRQPNLGAEACESKSHSDSKRLVPSQQVVPVREQPFREDLWVPACRAASVSWRSCTASRNSSPAPSNLAAPVRELLLTVACSRER